MFQHTAARRRLVSRSLLMRKLISFQHTAARRRLVRVAWYLIFMMMFQHTAARRRLAPGSGSADGGNGFNTQPPEGGWAVRP